MILSTRLLHLVHCSFAYDWILLICGIQCHIQRKILLKRLVIIEKNETLDYGNTNHVDGVEIFILLLKFYTFTKRCLSCRQATLLDLISKMTYFCIDTNL